MSVTRGQCDARSYGYLPSLKHHRPLAGTILYCLVTEAQVYLTTCPGLQSIAGWLGFDFEPATYSNKTIHDHDTRQKQDFHTYSVHSESGKRAIKHKGGKLWNNLPDDLKGFILLYPILFISHIVISHIVLYGN